MYHFIINPSSRSSKGLVLWRIIRKKLDELKIHYKSYITSCSHNGAAIAREITAAHTNATSVITVLGGDGTLNEVINGISSFKNIILGYIPVGGGNDFARGLNLSTNPLEALEHILNPKFYKMINYGVVSTSEGERNFLVSSGMGYDASVCAEISSSPYKGFLNKIGLGRFAYAVLGIKKIFHYKPVDTTIILDYGKKITVKNMLFASIHNQKYEGGGFSLCPDADYTDDLLDICVVENISNLKALLLLPLAFFGKHVLFKEIKNYRCKNIEIHSNSSVPLHTDGEPLKTGSHISASCGYEKICIITG